MLETINSPNDVKKLGEDELDALCADIRKTLIKTLAKTGGHLASNLGAVELTVAIHRVYDTARDRLVFDVGHQCYAHKLLTGRQEGFAQVRHLGGVSGFPKPYESVHDAFIAGHASNSVSVALGMARARTALGQDYDVVCLIGDGALSGGLAFEGLSQTGASGERIVVILNDNAMSIDPSSGGIADMLARLRVRPAYLRFKKWYRRFLGRTPALYGWLHHAKAWVKARILPDNMFDDFGFDYIGPIDGHDVHKVADALRWAKEQDGPCLVHVITQKGRGYAPAEQTPEFYHGVGGFDVKTGALPAGGDDFSAVFGRTLTELAGEDERIVAITAAMMEGTGLTDFAKAYPKRFFDVGIAEQHACAMAAGMARQGLTPVFAVYSSFLQRSYDMLIHDIALQNLHVVLCVDRAGIVGRDGETHQGAFDVSYLSSVPNMTVLSPSDFSELRAMLRRAIYEIDGPVAVRYPRGGEGALQDDLSAGHSVLLRDGTDVTIAAYGTGINDALDAAQRLEDQGVSAAVVKLNELKPLRAETALASLRKTGRLVVPEETCQSGCVGMELLSAAAAEHVSLRDVKLINLGEGIVGHGSPAELKNMLRLDGEGIAAAAMELINGKNTT